MRIIGSTIGFIAYLIQVITKNKKSFIVLKLYSLADKYDNRSKLSLAAYGMLLFEDERYDKALKQFKKVKKINKKSYLDRIAAMNMALCYWKLDSIDKAIEVLEELRSKYEYLNENILTSLGYFYLLNDDCEKALYYSNQALDDEPEHAPALDNLGQIYYKKDDLKKAEEYFLKALEYKDMVDSKYFLGLIYEKQGKEDEAREYFRKAYNTKISKFSTVSRDVLEEKYKVYKILKE